ncbi:MAG TPA: DHH family phosphoesterase [Candidatus Onthovivens sp.]|nr:DHH family phosphoesterase [Candidatus Onthovivens sp.]
MKKIFKQIEISSLIVTALLVAFIGIFFSLYIVNVNNIQETIGVEVVGYIALGVLIFNLFTLWVYLLLLFEKRHSADLTTNNILGKDIKEAYNFGKIGFIVIDDSENVIWVSEFLTSKGIDILNQNVYNWLPKLRDLITTNEVDTIVVNPFGTDFMVKYLKASNLFIFKDVTDYESLYKYTKEQESCVGIIIIDNYNDISGDNDDTSDTIANVKALIFEYAKANKILLRAYKSDSYFAICNNLSLKGIINDGFSILDKVRKVGTNELVQPSLSIGFSSGFPDISRLNEMAANAADIAMSRGGDQAVVNNYGSELSFFGGKTEATEKRNKVRVRTVADSLIGLINRSNNVVIMGHRDMDMDALGACLGIKTICDYCQRPSFIVYEPKLTERKTKSALTTLFSREELSKFIVNAKEAEEKIRGTTLVVVCDVSRPHLVMSPGCLTKTDKIIIIDHHRRASEFIENNVLYYIEPSSSSTCELVTELIRYTTNFPPIVMSPRVATIMLSGIFLDTTYFKSRTVGIRTFEASMILKDFGADNSMSDDLLKDEFEEYEVVSKLVATKKTPHYGVSLCRGEEDDIFEVSTLAKAANQCMQLKGNNAVFVIGRTGDNEIRVSARSDGSINVQTLVEKFGGGGHFSAAAALFKDTTIENVEKIVLDTLNDYISGARAQVRGEK